MPNAAIQNNLYFLCENPNWFFCRIADLEKQLEEAREGTGEESLGEENATLKKKIEAMEENKKKVMEVIKKAKKQVEEKTEEKKKDDLAIKALKAQLEAKDKLVEGYKNQDKEMNELKARLTALSSQKGSPTKGAKAKAAVLESGGPSTEAVTASVKPVIAAAATAVPPVAAAAPQVSAVRPTPIRQTASIQPTPATSRGAAQPQPAAGILHGKLLLNRLQSISHICQQVALSIVFFALSCSEDSF